MAIITKRIRVFAVVVITSIFLTMGSKRPAAQSGYTLIPITSPFGAVQDLAAGR